ncbi:MAG: hypothetical protein JNM31_02115 [Flavobacteriales bacterium]|nr:hypothetical protein [Flavobacteriales bacterium]
MRLHLLFFSLLATSLTAQDLSDRHIVLQEMTIPNMPGLQSFAWGQHDGEWLLVGGRTDGLHRRQPFAAFLATDNNTMAYAVDPMMQQVWSASLATLSTGLFEQLQCTNLEFEQRDTVLYIVGGYGYSPTAADHITHTKLTAINLPGAIAAIKNGTPLAPHFRQLDDTRMAVTGGQMGRLNNEFFLVGGQRFIGRYNPMGPTSGPGFIQEYTNAIRRFQIDDDGTNLSIQNFTEVVDTMELHRRDYNMVRQVFPDGTQGFTVFSGVFQYAADIPWLNTVNVTPAGYTVVAGFEQLLNQYHSAHLVARSDTANRTSTVFFGGIGRFFYDANGVLMDDVNVPFVNTISKVERAPDWSMTETAIGAMPALLGSGAEFLPMPSVPMLANGIIDLDALSGDTVLAGHIVGGIESSAPNIFFINTGTQSDATTRLFRVLLVRDMSTDQPELDTAPRDVLRVTPTDSGDAVLIGLELLSGGPIDLYLLDSRGRRVRNILSARMPAGSHQLRADVRDLPPGTYLIELRSERAAQAVRFVR